MFDDFLKSDKDVDPVLTPYFGHPNAVYVPMNIQLEVYRLLQTYQALMAENLANGAALPVIIPENDLVIPAGGGFQYHQLKLQFNTS